MREDLPIILEFWKTCHKILDIAVPDITTTSHELFKTRLEHCIPGFIGLVYQFSDKRVQINPALRHESTDK